MFYSVLFFHQFALNYVANISKFDFYYYIQLINLLLYYMFSISMTVEQVYNLSRTDRMRIKEKM